MTKKRNPNRWFRDSADIRPYWPRQGFLATKLHGTTRLLCLEFKFSSVLLWDQEIQSYKVGSNKKSEAVEEKNRSYLVV